MTQELGMLPEETMARRVPGYSGGRGLFNRLDPGCPEWADLGVRSVALGQEGST